jgi:hypothetical protein
MKTLENIKEFKIQQIQIQIQIQIQQENQIQLEIQRDICCIPLNIEMRANVADQMKDEI